jgi:quercetin dioxygenase-like cupin family protein
MGVVHKFIGDASNYDWEGVAVKRYDRGDVKGASKKVLMGAQEGSDNFRVRYFRIEPGGYSRLEQHPHEHGVYMLHGRAMVRHGDETSELGAGDVVYIRGNEWHQLTTIGDEPLGFLCVVTAQAEP